MARIPRFHFTAAYYSGDIVDLGFASCNFKLKGKVPSSGARERIRLIEYFPAFQQISDQCMERPQDYAGGRTPVGKYFLASMGADGLLGSMGNNVSTGVVTA